MTQKELAGAAWRMVHKANAEELAALSVSEIARRLMVNRSTLSRAFSAYYPYFTLRELLEMQKISKFDMLVMFNKVKTVKEALEILDIRDRNHFIKRYKAARQRTPGEFCKKCRKSHKEWRRRFAEMHGFCDKNRPLKHLS
jgi:AraC-like DNA-binding protein